MMIQHRNARRSGAAALALLGATLCSAATHAAEPATAFVMVAYSNQTGGPHIVAGDYRGAALALNQHSQLSPLDPGAVATNRCVSFAMTAQMFAAHRACDEAVEEEQRAEDGSVLQQQNRRQHDASAALVYSNRAVLHWLTADAAAAQADLARAQALAPQADFVIRNLAALRDHPGAPAARAAVGLARTSE
jgi:hypothetical protein